MIRPIAIDLFAGAGGLSLGFEQAGFDVVAAVELDPIHCAVHKFNFPHCATICRSVTDLSGAEIRTVAGIGRRDIDVVVGGAPCQGFSLIGKRALDDPRNQLVYHFVRIVLELKPKHFVFENVKGLTLGKHRQFLQEVISAFQASGYDVAEQYRVLNAADYGVPQDRHRLFLLGSRKGRPLPTYPTPSRRTTVGQAIGDLPEVDKLPALWNRDWAKAKFRKPSAYAVALREPSRDALNFAYARLFDPTIITSSMLTEHTDLSKQRFSATTPGEVEPISRFKRLSLDGVCNTLRAGTASDRGAFTSPRPIHPTQPRVITVREAARLHSYPDWFRFHVTKWHGFRQVGNSVPPLLARAVGSAVMQALGVQPKKPSYPIALENEGLLSANMADAAAHFGVSRYVIPQRNRQDSSTLALFEPESTYA